MPSEPVTLDQLIEKLCSLKTRLGATGEELVFIEGSIATGIEGLKLGVRAKARNASLCRPATLGDDHPRIVSIWGVPDA